MLEVSTFFWTFFSCGIYFTELAVPPDSSLATFILSTYSSKISLNRPQDFSGIVMAVRKLVLTWKYQKTYTTLVNGVTKKIFLRDYDKYVFRNSLLIFSYRCLGCFGLHRSRNFCSQFSYDDLREVLHWNHHLQCQILPGGLLMHFENLSCLELVLQSVTEDLLV